MREEEILSAIDAANGEVPAESLFAGIAPGAGQVNLTNTLAKMRRVGQIRYVRHEDGSRTYVRASGGTE